MDTICKICGKTGFKRFKMHVLNKHNLTMEVYDKLDIMTPVDEAEVPEELEVSEKVEENLGKTLSDVLTEFEISEVELYNILRKVKYGSNKKMAEVIVKKESDALRVATELAESNENEIQVNNVYIAEALKNSFGFKCEKVVGKQIGNVLEKTWIMKK